MPESVRDRPTNSYEHVFLLAKSQRYFYDAEAVKEPLQQSSLERGYSAAYFRNDAPKMQSAPGDVRAKENWRANAYIPSGRNLRSVWTINPAGFPGAHFATFPPALVRPMILAGTSARGVCSACLAPFERVTEKVAQLEAGRRCLGLGPKTGGDRMTTHGQGETTLHHTVQSDTLGWRPGCDCDAGEPIPATVLDPFIGSGTTCHVAEELGRDSIGIDLSGDYVQMARRRIDRTPAIETTHNGQPVTVEQVPMFEVVS
jgi:hypothetical protein